MRHTLPFLLLGVLLAAPTFAQVPSTISYQGVLTDGSGTLLLDGNYNITFRIWDDPWAGNLLYTEVHNPVFVQKGGFSVLLGSLTPLPNLFNRPLYLGIQVDPNPEMAPRVPLSAMPYALGMRVPFNLGGTSANPLLVGYQTAGGMALDLLPPNPGGLNIALEPDFDGSGGFFSVTRSHTQDGFFVDGNSGSQEPRVGILGSVRSVVFDMMQADNGAVQLPFNAIAAAEIRDEPGISQDRFVGTRTILGGLFNVNVSTTITIPADGYVVVEATGSHVYGGTNNSQNWADCWISMGAPSDVDPNYAVRSGITAYSAVPALPTLSEVVSLHRTWFLAAGNYTFNFESKGQSVGGGTNQMVNPTITATYFPTSYGTVTALVSGADAASFSRATPVAASPDGAGIQSTGVSVDLRELELRATRAAADAERAQRALVEAQLLEQARMRRNAHAGVKP